MAKSVNPRSVGARERWAGIIEEQRRSCLGVRAFCRKRGVGEHSFYTWRRRLRGARPERPATPRPRGTPRPGGRSAAAKEPGFLPVRVVSRGAPRSGIEIEFRSPSWSAAFASTFVPSMATTPTLIAFRPAGIKSLAAEAEAGSEASE